ncbi:hypothetical protein EKH57_15580 [Halorubrum sp. BOL3-1]|uniref:PKD domain-containing protein n=1 Tax=Halorubrum sp. BOL3-1 TaxID=2497325 RepID=UPI001004EEE4|nr:PKD domain-containing protein [Halorubrum sp. BOL3-1]QAU14012.1 hypothetical protein EKH57_15580 [Halorubrum sp. BOL3-1]
MSAWGRGRSAVLTALGAAVLGALVVAAVGVPAVGATGVPTVGAVGEPTVGTALSAEAACTLSDTEARPGDEVTLNARDSANASLYEFDRAGDGIYEASSETDPTHAFQYEREGTFTPRVRVTDGSDDTQDVADCGELVVSDNRPPNATLTSDPTDPEPGEEVTLDGSDATDPDGDGIRFWGYDIGGDGTYDYTGDGAPPDPVTHTFQQEGTYDVRLDVEDEHGAVGSDVVTVDVRADPTGSCTVSPAQVAPGGSVTLNASSVENANYVRFDIDGDGTHEVTDEVDFVVEWAYEDPGEYDPTVTAYDAAANETFDCGTVTVNAPPEPALDVSPSPARPGEEVTLDASGSTSPGGEIAEYRWDFEGDGTVDETTSGPTALRTYDGGEYAPSVTVVDETGATATTEADLPVQSDPDPTVRCVVEPAEVDVGDVVTVDASASDGPERVEVDVHDDGEIDYVDEDAFAVTHRYEEAGEYRVVVRGVTALGADTATCGVVQVIGGSDGGGGEPLGPIADVLPPDALDALLPVLAVLLGLGALAGLIRSLLGPSGDGGDGDDPPRPPSPPPGGPGVERYYTDTFATPTESDTVAVAGLGFEPDLLRFTAAPDVRAADVRATDGGAPDAGTLADGDVPDRTTGWTHGCAVRTDDGELVQTATTVAADAEGSDAGIGVAADGHALELVHHYDDPPGRLLGTVTGTDSDGFEVAFDASELRDERAGDSFTVLFQAFSLTDDAEAEVGHFRTPPAAGTQSIDLGVDANHATLLAGTAVSDVGDRAMTDVSVGFSYADVVGRTDPGQAVRSVVVESSGRTAVSRAVRVDRGIHLPFGRDDDVTGHTTGRVTGLGDRLDVEYEKRYSGPSKVGSDDSTLVTYVAVDAGWSVPDIGYFQLPEPESDEPLAVDVGFRPGLVEFTTVGLDGVDAERTSVTSPLAFDWSQGTVMASDGELAQFSLDGSADRVDRSGTGDGAVALSVRAVAESGHVVGRDDLRVTAFTDEGFRLTVTGVDTDRRDEAGPRPYVLYKAWPDPDAG